MATFGENFLNLLTHRQLTPYRLGLDLGVDHAVLWNIAHGRRKPSPRILSLLASAEHLGVTEQQLKAWMALEDYGQEVIHYAAGMSVQLPMRGLLQNGSILWQQDEQLLDFSIPPNVFAVQITDKALEPTFKQGGWLLLQQVEALDHYGYYVIQTSIKDLNFTLVYKSAETTNHTLVQLTTGEPVTLPSTKRNALLYHVSEYRLKPY